MEINPKVGLIDSKDLKRFRKEVCERDPIWSQYLNFKRSNKTYAPTVAEFLYWLTKAMGRDPWRNPVTPSEFRQMRLNEIKTGSATSEVKHIILAFLEYMRHTCTKCGHWIEGNPLARENMPTMKCPKCGGTNLAAGTRNTKAMAVRGFLRATIDMEGASPFRKGENFPEYGWNKTTKVNLTPELYQRLLDVANDEQKIILVLLRQTGMSRDILTIKITSFLLDQLNKEPLPDVVLIPWRRTKTMGKDAGFQRYTGVCGDGVKILKAWIEYKGLKEGDWLLPGHNGKPLSERQLQWNFKQVVKKAGIKTNGERLSPHVLRAAAFSDLAWAKDHDFAKYVTGKTVGIEIITYYNNHLDMIIEAYRKCIPRMNPMEKVRQENLTLKERLNKIEAENKELKEMMKLLMQEMAELRRELMAVKGETPADKLKQLAII